MGCPAIIGPTIGAAFPSIRLIQPSFQRPARNPNLRIESPTLPRPALALAAAAVHAPEGVPTGDVLFVQFEKTCSLSILWAVLPQKMQALCTGRGYGSVADPHFLTI